MCVYGDHEYDLCLAVQGTNLCISSSKFPACFALMCDALIFATVFISRRILPSIEYYFPHVYTHASLIFFHLCLHACRHGM